MKKEAIGIFTVLIFLFVSIPIQAQNNEMSHSVSVLPESDNLNGKRNYFSIGWANLFSHFPINGENYAEPNQYFLSPGFELQISYHINNNLRITSGISNQLFHYKTPVPNETYPPNEINTVHLNDLGFPFLLNIKLIDLNGKSKISLTSGIYFWKPIFAEYTSNYKIWGGTGHYARSITYTISENYSSLYAGIGIYHTISAKYFIYTEPYINYQLTENWTTEVRNKFWFGIKLGINYLIIKNIK